MSVGIISVLRIIAVVAGICWSILYILQRRKDPR